MTSRYFVVHSTMPRYCFLSDSNDMTSWLSSSAENVSCHVAPFFYHTVWPRVRACATEVGDFSLLESFPRTFKKKIVLFFFIFVFLFLFFSLICFHLLSLHFFSFFPPFYFIFFFFFFFFHNTCLTRNNTHFCTMPVVSTGFSKSLVTSVMLCPAHQWMR
jgi:hypothetical protein